MKVIGLAGQFCSGKDTVAKMFARAGLKIIDADKLGHSVLRSLPVRKKLLSYFGKGITGPSGAIDRRRLAKHAFKDKRTARALCAITHPPLVKKIRNRLRGIGLRSPDAVVVINAAVFLEMGLLKDVDLLVVVKARASQLAGRAGSKWGMSPKEAFARVRLQMPLKRLVKAADFIIDNSGTIEKTRKQVALIRRHLWKS